MKPVASEKIKSTARKWTKAAAVVVSLICLTLGTAGNAREDRDWIRITRKVSPSKVAVPGFRSLNDSDREQSINKLLIRKMRDTINFTGLFEVIDPEEYPAVIYRRKETDFERWQEMGAQFLLKGNVADLGDGRYQIELRFYDVNQQKMVLGKRYTGEKDLLNRMVLRFVDEMIGWLHPNKGKGNLDARIAYVNKKSGKNEIHVMDTDGSHDRAITANRTLNLSPAWSPNARYIIFTGYQDRNPDLYLANLNQGRKWKLYGKRGLNLAGEFSPDGNMVAFTRENSAGNMDIYIIGTDGRGLKRVTTSPSIEISPTWSPDGKLLAFVSNRSGSPQIYLLDLTKGAESARNRPIRITRQGRYNTSPAWSPDGRYIAYSGRVGGQFDLFLISMSGDTASHVKRITRTNADEENPAWSPDSRFMIFDSNKHGNYDIFITSIYTGSPKRITKSRADEKMPSWSPRIELE
ncbi:MAG: hypothetical protein R6V10_04105 [bacterium]